MSETYYIDALQRIPRFVYLFGYLTDGRCVLCAHNIHYSRSPLRNVCNRCDGIMRRCLPYETWERYRGG